MPRDDDHAPAGHFVWRGIRRIVPWIGLIIVMVVLWTMFSDYRAALESPETTSTVEATVTAGVPDGQPYVVVLSDGLNLRAEPSTTSAIVKVLGSDQHLLLLEEGTGWYRVRDDGGIEGWVAAGGRYTELVRP